MIEDKEIWAYEKAYLQRVAGEIKKQIDIGADAADRYKSDAVKLQKSMWEDVKCAPSGLADLENVVQINQIQMDLINKAGLYKFSFEKVSRLKKMLGSPYFGRIDFCEKGEKAADKIYIGVSDLTAYDTMESFVYDWRAPVSSMFYDFETGPSAYSCPAGLIEGEILLKRQYKIAGSEIAYMFDSSLTINDAMLQELLGKSTDVKMGTIVASIQKEQNTVIRNSRDRILIVEGPAGSGKTSIALHRAAYLLYKYRETIKSENILIFSPNHVFEDYISHVLPELGEENIKRSTFADFFRGSFPFGWQRESSNQQMEYILTSEPGDIRLESIKFKSSPVFLAALKRFVQFLEDGNDLKFKDLKYRGSLLISAGDIYKLYKNQSVSLPYANRLEKIRKRLLMLMKEWEKKTRIAEKSNPAVRREPAEYELLKDDILQMTAFDICRIYIHFLKGIGSFALPGENETGEYSSLARFTLVELERGMMNYEDLAPVVYLKAVLEGTNAAASIKHIIIDEAQDYTPVQYEIFKTVFRNCNMTILGDINQAVNSCMNIGDFGTISDITGAGSERVALKKSYRSSKELADFCRSLLVSPGETEQLERRGAKPKVIKVSRSGCYKRIADDISGLKSKGYKLIAVVCKTASQCRDAYRHLASIMDIRLISNKNEAYNGDVIVIPSYLAKGLEFDAVLVNSIEDRAYSASNDRRLLYTVCTRALHELYLYYTDTMSEIVSGIDKELYAAEDAAV